MSSSTAAFPNVSSAVAAGRSGPSSASAFFEHHGAWAPGVRLFRTLNFRAKALIISSIFMVPVALLAWNFLKDKADAIEFSAKERVGVAYLRDAVPLVKLGQIYRLRALQAHGTATSELAEARKALEAQMRKIDEADRALGADLGTTKALAAVKATALAAASAAPEAVFEAHSAHIDAVLTLIGQATDGSNLTLDPDLDTYYLMDGSLGALPVLVEAAAKLRGASATVAASGKPAGENLQRTIVSSAVATELFESRVTTALDKVYGVHPEFKADDLLPQLRAFRELAVAGKSDAATLVTRGTAPVDTMIALQGSMLDKLDLLLQARINGMARHRNLTMIAVSLALLIGGYLFYSFYLVTQGGLNEVKRHLLAMTDGDLTTSPNPWGQDEAAALMLSLHDMQASLRNIVSRVRGSSESIVHASTEIASASMDLSARTEQTASNLEESAASMEEISSTVKHTADNVKQAALVAQGNSQSAARGGAVIKTLITSSVEKVESGARVVNGAGDTMQELVGNADQMNALLSEISTAASEQSSGVAQVGAAVHQLDEMTQQNAALVEQTAAAASSLRDQALNLATEVARFRMPNDR